MSEHRRSRSDLDRSGIVAAALFAPFLLVLALIAYTVQSERSRADTEARVLRDYGSIAGAELERQVTQLLHEQIARAVRPADGTPVAGGHPRDGRPMIDPAAFLRSDSALADSCAMLAQVRGAFRLEPGRGRLTTAGDVPAALAGAIVARVGEASSAGGEPHRLTVIAEGGRATVVAFETVRDGATGAPLVYGVTSEPSALASVFREVLAKRPMVPSELLRPPHTPEHLRVAVASAEGLPLWNNAPLDESVASSVDTLPPHVGSLVIRVQAGPAVAEALRIGRPSALYLPALGGLLILSAALAIMALLQLRRTKEVARLRTRFVANVSHELRTPLTQISMFAEMLALGRVRDGRERQHYAEVIRREVNRLSTLVEGVLRFARAEEGRSSIRLERRDLSLEVRAAVEFFAPVAVAADVLLEVSTESDVWADVDPGALRQVLLNLLDNAVKHGPRGQTVGVIVARSGGTAAITVADEGPGIPAAERERIFEPYTRLERPDRPRVAGAGIGLAVVLDLVRAHGGTVQVAERTRGTAMVVTLPGAPSPMERETGHAHEGETAAVATP